MINWEKYIKWGNFKSAHGLDLPFKWEFDRLEIEPTDKKTILISILSACLLNDLVVINTVHPIELRKYANTIYYPKKNLIKKQSGNLGKYVLYDDVITTFQSMSRCIEKIGYSPEFCLCIIDRRDGDFLAFGKDLNIISIKRDL